MTAQPVFFPVDGTAKNEPPQLPPPSGNVLAMRQPGTPSALSRMMLAIHAGVTTVAHCLFWKPAPQSACPIGMPAEMPFAAASANVMNSSRICVLSAMSYGLPLSGSSKAAGSRLIAAWKALESESMK